MLNFLINGKKSSVSVVLVILFDSTEVKTRQGNFYKVRNCVAMANLLVLNLRDLHPL